MVMNSRKKNQFIVESVLRQGLSAAEVARKHGVSRQWVYKLIARYQKGGPEALAPHSRAPHRPATTTAPALQDEIIRIRKKLVAEGSDAGPIRIRWQLQATGHTAPSESTIRRILHQARLITPEPKKRPKSSYRSFVAEAPNGCWQADVTHLQLANGTRVDVLDFLDDHSRLLLHLKASLVVTGSDVVEAMSSLINTYGVPASTLTDNGLIFTARFSRGGNNGKPSRNGFETLLAAHGITQKNGRPGHPETQGKIERFHQTLKRWIYKRPAAQDLDELQALLDEFRIWYNTARPHYALKGQTPERVYLATPKDAPDPSQDKEYRTRHDVIDSNGKLTLRYAGQLRHLGIGRAWAGTRVLMLIHGDRVTTSDAATGEIIAEHHINPNKDYQPKLKHPGTE